MSGVNRVIPDGEENEIVAGEVGKEIAPDEGGAAAPEPTAQSKPRAEDEKIARYKADIRSTFAMVQPTAQTAAGMFYERLWEVDPSLKGLFADTDMGEHKPMRTLSVAVDMLDDMAGLVPLLKDLGKRLVEYGVTAPMYDTVGGALLWTLENSLGNAWTEGAREAWAWIYGVIQGVCIEAANEVVPDYDAPAAAKATRKAEMRAVAEDEKMARYKADIRSTFALVEPIAPMAAGMFFERLWGVDPSLKELFADTDMGKQKGKLMRTLSMVVDMLDDMEGLVPLLRDLGKRHVEYGVTAPTYDTVGGALLWTLENSLGNAWTDGVKEAWTWGYGVIQGMCIEGAKEVVPEYDTPAKSVAAPAAATSWEAAAARLLSTASPPGDAEGLAVHRHVLKLCLDVLAVRSSDYADAFLSTLQEGPRRPRDTPPSRVMTPFSSPGPRRQAEAVAKAVRAAANAQDEEVSSKTLAQAIHRAGRRLAELGTTAADLDAAIDAAGQAAATVLGEGVFGGAIKDAWAWLSAVLRSAGAKGVAAAKAAAAAAGQRRSPLAPNKQLGSIFWEREGQPAAPGDERKNLKRSKSATTAAAAASSNRGQLEAAIPAVIAVLRSEGAEDAFWEELALAEGLAVKGEDDGLGGASDRLRALLAMRGGWEGGVSALEACASLLTSSEGGDRTMWTRAELESWRAAVELGKAPTAGSPPSAPHSSDFTAAAEALLKMVEGHMGPKVANEGWDPDKAGPEVGHFVRGVALGWGCLLDEAVALVRGTTMTSRQVELTKTTWASVSHAGPLVMMWFHEYLFAKDPSCQEVYGSTQMDQQSAVLSNAISTCVSLLEDMPALLQLLEDMGRRHALYGVKLPHYESGRDALLWTLSKAVSGGLWSKETEVAWSSFWTLMVGGMTSGADEAMFCKHVSAIARGWERSVKNHQLTIIARTEALLAKIRPRALDVIQGPLKWRAGPIGGVLALMETISAASSEGVSPPWFLFNRWCQDLGKGLREAGMAAEGVESLFEAFKAAIGLCIGGGEGSAMAQSEEMKAHTDAFAWVSQAAVGCIVDPAERATLRRAELVRTVKESWQSLEGVTQTVGEVFYGKLFATSPVMAQMFSGTDVTQQARRFVAMVNAVVVRCGEEARVVPLLQELGVMHAKLWNVKPGMYDTVLGVFLATLKECLGLVGWTKEVEAAWGWVVDVIKTHMKPAKITHEAGDSLSGDMQQVLEDLGRLPGGDSGEAGATAAKLAAAEKAFPEEITPHDVQLLTESWGALESAAEAAGGGGGARGPSAVGEGVYRGLVEGDASAKQALSRLPGQSLDLRGRAMAQALKQAVSLAGNPKELARVMAPLGERHCKYYGASPESYAVGKSALLRSLEAEYALLPPSGEAQAPPSFGPDLARAWARLWDRIAHAMEPKYKPDVSGFQSPAQAFMARGGKVPQPTPATVRAKVREAVATPPAPSAAANSNLYGLAGIRGQRTHVPVELAAREVVSADGQVVQLLWRLDKAVAFAPGQYVKVRVDKPDGTWAARFYSISKEAPVTPATTDTIEVMVRVIPGGTVSPFIGQEMSVGDKANLVAIGGTFCLPIKPDTRRYYVVFVSGGVGITPFMSMARSLAERARGGLLTAAGISYECIFIHGTRESAYICKEELEQIEQEFPLTHDPANDEDTPPPPSSSGFGLRMFPAVSWPRDDELAGLKHQGVHLGRVTRDVVSDLMCQHRFPPAETWALTCGPTQMMRSVVTWVKELGVPDKQAMGEFFDI